MVSRKVYLGLSGAFHWVLQFPLHSPLVNHKPSYGRKKAETATFSQLFPNYCLVNMKIFPYLSEQQAHLNYGLLNPYAAAD